MQHFPGWLLLLLLLCVGCGSSGSPQQVSESLGKQLSSISFKQVEALGPHLYEASIKLSLGGQGGKREVDEQHSLAWTGWDRYRYRVQKNGLATLDVTVWQGKVFQVQPDGRIRTRDNTEEAHYYLRQTWNPWEGVIQPFKAVAVYEYQQLDELDGRSVERYRIGFQPRLDAPSEGTDPLRRSTVVERLEGKLWLDRTTGVPLQIQLEGAWKQVRYARRPGSSGEEAPNSVVFTLRRSGFGKHHVTGPPEALARP